MKDSASDQYEYIHESFTWFLEQLSPDELNQLEDIIVNHYGEDDGANPIRDFIGKVNGPHERG